MTLDSMSGAPADRGQVVQPEGEGWFAGLGRFLRAPRWRLQAFALATYLIVLGLLAWTGFNELYASLPTFGVDGAANYLTLFLWGFGAEATRSAVTDLVKGLVASS